MQTTFSFNLTGPPCDTDKLSFSDELKNNILPYYHEALWHSVTPTTYTWNETEVISELGIPYEDMWMCGGLEWYESTSGNYIVEVTADAGVVTWSNNSTFDYCAVTSITTTWNRVYVRYGNDTNNSGRASRDIRLRVGYD